MGYPPTLKAIRSWPYSFRDGFHQGHSQREELEWTELPPAVVGFVPGLQWPWSFTGVGLMDLRVQKYPVLFRVCVVNLSICITVWATTLGQRELKQLPGC